MSPTELTSRELEDLFGTLMGGTWTNTLLFSCELYFTYLRLFANSGRESYWTQLGLIAIVIVDGVSTVCGYATVWMYAVQYWGDLSILGVQVVPIRICVVATAIAAVVFHLFQALHARRILKATSPRWAVVSMLLWPCALMPLVGVIWSWVGSSLQPDNPYAWMNSVLISTTTDHFFGVFILLVFVLNRNHPLVTAPESVARSWNATSWAIVMGLPASIVSILMVTLAHVLPRSNITVALGLNAGRIYTLSMLFVIYRDSGELNLEAVTAAASPALGWTTGSGEGPNGIVVDIKTQHQVEINREAPLAAVKLGGLSDGMAPYSAKAEGTKTTHKERLSSRDTFGEDDF